LVGSIHGYQNVERWCHFYCYQDRSHYEWFRWTPKIASFVDLVLSHGKNAAQLLCPRELKADGLAADSRRSYHGAVKQLPMSKGYSDFYVEMAGINVTKLGACGCAPCSDFHREGAIDAGRS